MADTTCDSYLETAIKHTVGGTERIFRHPATAAQLLDEQRFLFFKLPIGVKITDAAMFGDDLDAGTAAITAFAGITDGTTVHGLCGTAASPLTAFRAANDINRLDQTAALGLVLDSNDWFAYVHLKAAPDTAAAGLIGLMVSYTPVLDNGA